jgi:glycosyltransferase involved in cell wall biosynthesis
MVVAAGRLVPVKRHHVLIDALARVREEHPGLEAVITGDGYERAALEEARDRAGARDWLHLPGWLSDDALVDLYRRAWLVASASVREGWGMTITEAAACGTPAVVTDIGGHRDAVIDGETGLLARDPDDLARKIATVLSDDVLRKDLGERALARAGGFTWDATARGALEALASEAHRRHRRRHRRR